MILHDELLATRDVYLEVNNMLSQSFSNILPERGHILGISVTLYGSWRYTVEQLVDILHYKPEVRGFDSGWGQVSY